MMIAQWVSGSKARLSVEANYLLLLQAVLTFLSAAEGEIYASVLLHHLVHKHREGSKCMRSRCFCLFLRLYLGSYFQFRKFTTDFVDVCY
jgi:hypothetical protein